jgi:hypothetical protein
MAETLKLLTFFVEINNSTHKMYIKKNIQFFPLFHCRLVNLIKKKFAVVCFCRTRVNYSASLVLRGRHHSIKKYKGFSFSFLVLKLIYT